MDQEVAARARALYAEGMALFREGHWDEALVKFRELQGLPGYHAEYPEVDALAADIQLKIEIQRLNAPVGAAAPRRRRRWPIAVGAAAALLLVAGGAAVTFGGVLSGPAPTPAPTRAVRVVSLPTAAATSTPTPEPTSIPTPTPTATATPEPTAVPTEAPTGVPQPGALVVRTADGQQLTKTTGNIAIIVDASGSMLAQLKGKAKIDIARDALKQLVEKLPDTTNVGMSTYGTDKARGCKDFTTLTPLGPLKRDEIGAQIDAIQPAPNSPTPLGLSLQSVAAQLKGVKGETLIVLVTDGEETCKADPAAIAAEVRAANPDVKIAVVGFNIGTDAARTNLSKIAESGGGSYFDAGDTAQLVSALRQAIVINYRVTDAEGKEVFSGPLGAHTTLNPGSYKVTIGDTRPLVVDVVVGANKETAIEVRESGGKIVGGVVGQ